MAGYVYILASKKEGTLYVGVTSDLPRRVDEHKAHRIKGFTDHYDVTRLVWFEKNETIQDAIHREKRIKKWPRRWKLNLIAETNPDWDDLSAEIGLL